MQFTCIKENISLINYAQFTYIKEVFSLISWIFYFFYTDLFGRRPGFTICIRVCLSSFPSRLVFRCQRLLFGEYLKSYVWWHCAPSTTQENLLTSRGFYEFSFSDF